MWSGIVALGYIGVRSDQLDDWGRFASGLLGMQSVDRGAGQVSFRMDDHKQRLLVLDEPGATLAFLGFEAASSEALEHVAARLETAGTAVTRAPRDLCARRFVSDLLTFVDPAGNSVEVFAGPETTSDNFVPGRPISGFKTGPLGMGHVVLKSPSVEELVPFYRDVLGFAVSDFGRSPYPLYFFHLNERHHSFAMVGAPAPGLHHFMVEYGTLDDVGQGYDLALLEEGRVAYTLRRHTNDYMTSFYAHSPSGFFVENGWGGRLIDPRTWESHETFDGPSFWGHDRTYMDEPQRKHLEVMRLDAAARGKQAPPMIDCPWLWQTLDQAGRR